MDFEFNDQQVSFRDAFRTFFAGDPAAVARPGLDDQHWRDLADLGLFAMLVPEDRGGLGLQLIDAALVIEELGRALTRPLACETLIAADLIAHYGSDRQKAELLPRIAAGQLRVTSAVVEPDAGFGAGEVRTTLRGRGGRLVLDGVKILVPEATQADLLLVACTDSPNEDLALVLVEPGRAGVGLEEESTVDMTARMAEVRLSNVEVTSEDRLGESAATPAAVERLLDLSSTSAALQMMGIAGKVLDLSIAYAMDRIQFGKPIGAFQAIKHKCADMAVAIEAGRSAAYYAAWAVSEIPKQCTKPVSIAKAFTSDTVNNVCNEGTQIHGGMGFTWELGLHLYLRRAKVLGYLAGDAAYHRERVVRETLAELELT